MSCSNCVQIQSPNVHQLPEVQIAQIITKLFETEDTPTLIALGGPGGVGKSSFANKLRLEIGDCIVIRLDDYKVGRKEKIARNVSGPAPEANKMMLLEQNLKDLKLGKSIEKPCYNRVTGTCDELETVVPPQFVILDGEISTYRQFEKYLDFSLYIDAHWKTQLKTRTDRDIDLRGYSVKKAISTFLKSNMEEFPEHGAGTKRFADIQLWCESSYKLTISGVSPAVADQFGSILSRSEEELSLEKLFVAVTTPFRKDLEIDYASLVGHLRFLENSGIDAIFIGGTTGEFETLTFAEKVELLAVGRNNFSGLITFNVSSTSLKESLELIKVAEQGGANAVTALPPFYRANVGDDGIVKFFNTLSHATSLPFIIYNFTNHTQNAITPELLHRIEAVAIKDSDKNFDLIEPAELYLCAGDSIIADAISRGARGVVSVQGNYRPVEIRNLFHKSFDNPVQAKEIQKEVATVSAVFRKTKQISRIKMALSEILPGYPSYVRLPLVELNDEEKDEIVQWCKLNTDD